MKTIFTLVLSSIFFFTGRSQDCTCPPDAGFCKNGNFIKRYAFSNAKELALCGAIEVENKDTIYSGIDLFQCGQANIIQEWGEIFGCKANKIDDTLFVKEIDWLPVGKNFTSIAIPFYVHRYSFNESGLQDSTFYRNDIAKYSQAQIKTVLQKYKKLTKGNYDHTTDVANMLFWAYVSGSKEAGKCLEAIPKKFGPFDGAIAEDWDRVIATYEHWKSLNTAHVSNKGMAKPH